MLFVILRNPQNRIGQYSGPYIKLEGLLGAFCGVLARFMGLWGA